MMKKLLIVVAFVSATFNAIAQIPAVGRDTLIEMATWNLKWFGDPVEAPTNDALQFTNIKSVLTQTGIDIWGFQEMSEAQTWNTLTAQMGTRYMGVISTFSQTQKTAFLYDKYRFAVIPSLTGNVMTESVYNYNFAGRAPLRVTLQTVNRSVVDTVYFFIIHMKAMSDVDSYNRRVGAANDLKLYLDANYRNKMWAVLGDFNDDLYTSTYNNSPSPFLIFSDTTKYFFVSRQLTDAGKKSFASPSGRMIDHIMISPKLRNLYVRNSARVLDELSTAISNYSTTTTDHYPVLGYFDFRVKSPSTGLEGLRQHTPYALCYPNPASNQLFVQCELTVQELMLVDMQGKEVYKAKQQSDAFVITLPDLKEGIYLVQLHTEQGIITQRVMVKP